MTQEEKIKAAKNISDLIMEAAISKAIENKRNILKPSIEHFLSGGNINGEFDVALKNLMQWVENKTIEAIEAGRLAADEEKDNRIKELEEAIKAHIDWVDGRNEGSGTDVYFKFKQLLNK